MYNLQPDFSEYEPVNFLWNEFLEKFGEDKASKAIFQAIDVQSMHGEEGTLPTLFVETCGIGLVNMKAIKYQTGLSINGRNQVLLISIKKKLFQLLQKSA